MDPRTRKYLVGLLLVAVLLIVGIALMNSRRPAGIPGEPPSSQQSTVPAPVQAPAAESESAFPPATPSHTSDQESVSTSALAAVAPTPVPAATLEAGSNDFTLWLVGTIRDDSGAPIEGADVSLDLQRWFAPLGDGGAGRPNIPKTIETNRTRSGADGSYEMRLGDRFPYVVMARATGRAPTAEALFTQNLRIETDDTGRRVVRVDLTLSKGIVFSGRVVDQNKHPVDQAKVEAHLNLKSKRVFSGSRLNLETATGGDGSFSLSIPSDIAVLPLRLSKPGYTLVEYGVRNLSEKKDWVLSKFGGSISGRVVWEEDGRPVGGAAITAYVAKPANMGNLDPLTLSTVADGEGKFTLRPLSQDTWDVVANAPGDGSLGIPASDMVQIALGQDKAVDNVEIAIPVSLVVRGIVVNATTGEPISAARVYRKDWNGKEIDAAVTDDSGRFELPGLSITGERWKRLRRTLKAEKEGYLQGSVEKEMPDITQHVVEERIALTPFHTVRVSGRVLQASGAPAPNVLVLGNKDVYPESRGFTDATGRFNIPALANTDLDLECRPPEGPITYAKRIKTGFDPIPGLEIRLDPGGKLEVAVLSPDEKPVKGATVLLMRRTFWANVSSASRIESKTSGDDGTVLFKDLISSDAQLEPRLNKASVDVQATHPDFDSVEKRGVRIEPGTINHLEITLLAKDTSAEIDGVVHDSKGHPIEGVNVQFFSNSDLKSSTTDPLGYFQFKSLRPGKYVLQFNHPDYHPVSRIVTAPQLDLDVGMKNPPLRP